MQLKPIVIRWAVEVHPEALHKAQADIVRLYTGTARSDMEGWLRKFVLSLYDEPLHALGFPPRQAASDPDMLYYPGDPKAKVSGLAHVSKKRRVIHVYEIMIQLPATKEKKP